MRRDTTRQGKRLLLEASAAGDIALKLSSAIASARKVFRDRELQENAELQVRSELHLLKLQPQQNQPRTNVVHERIFKP